MARWLASFAMAAVIGVVVAGAVKRLQSRPQPITLPASVVDLPLVPEPSHGTSGAEPEPLPIPESPHAIDSLDDLLAFAHSLPGSGGGSAISRLKLDQALEERTVDQMEAWFFDAERRQGVGSRLDHRALRAIKSALLKRWLKLDFRHAIDRLATDSKGPIASSRDLGRALGLHVPQAADEILTLLPEPMRIRFLSSYLHYVLGGPGDGELREAFLAKHATEKELDWYRQNLEPQFRFQSLPRDANMARGQIEIMPKQQRDHAWRSFYDSIIDRYADPQAALEEAVRHGIDDQNPEVKSHFVYRVAHNWASSDLPATVEWLSRFDLEQRKETLNQVLNSTPMDPFEEMKIIDALPVGDVRLGTMNQIAEQAGMVDPVAAANWYLKQPDNESESLPLGLIPAWASVDPAGLIAHFSQPGNLEAREDHSDLIVLGEVIAQSDPDAAVAAAHQISSAKKRSSFVRGLVSGWTAVDPDAARDFVEAQTDSKLQDSALRGYLAPKLEVLPQEETLAWANALARPLRDEAMLRLAGSHRPDWDIRAMGKAVAAWLEETPGTIFEESRARSSLLIATTQMVSAGREAAAAWADELPDGTGRDIVAGAIAADWTTSDPDGASAWIATLPEGSTRDEAVTGLVGAFSDDPSKAFQWALAVGDPVVKAEQAASVLAEWQHTDPEAVAEALEALTESQRSDMLARARQIQEAQQ
jgi:hypothetical protein